MKTFIKILLGLTLGITTLSANAQTTRTLFTGGATLDRDYNIVYWSSKTGHFLLSRFKVNWRHSTVSRV